MEFFEAPAFTRLVGRYLTDDELSAVQNFLAIDPQAGDVMPGTGGFESYVGEIGEEEKVGGADCVLSTIT
jgi:hypothetical protein